MMKTYTVKLSELEMNALNFALSMAVDATFDGLQNSLESKSDHIISSWRETHRETETLYYRFATMEPDEIGS